MELYKGFFREYERLIWSVWTLLNSGTVNIEFICESESNLRGQTTLPMGLAFSMIYFARAWAVPFLVLPGRNRFVLKAGLWI